MIVFKDFRVSYSTKRVLSIDALELQKEKTYAVIGPSGCGKTTLLYALAGLLPSSAQKSGEIEFPQSYAVSAVLQDYGLYPWKTVLDNVLLPFSIQKNVSPEHHKMARDVMSKFKIVSLENQYPNTLSGGQKQRVALARAWLSESNILLLDEPFSALDAITRETLQDEVKRINALQPKTLFLVTHSIEEAAYLSEIIIVMTAGGEISEIIENPTYHLEDTRSSAQYFKLCTHLRDCLKAVQV